MVVKGFVKWNPVYDGKDSGLQLGLIPELLDQQASAQPIELSGLLMVLRQLLLFLGKT